MASKFYGDVCVGQEYKKGDETKKAWTKVGACFESDRGGLSVKLDLLPMPTEKGVWLSIFKKQAKAEPTETLETMSDEAPF